MVFLSLLLACQSPDPLLQAETEWIQDITVQTSEAIPSVLTVGFTTPESVTAWVEYGADQAGERATTGSTGTQHTHHLLGLAPLTDAQLQIVVEVDGEVHQSGALSAQTGQILPETPLPEVTINNYAPAEHATFLISIFSDPSYVVMMDLDGTVHWSLQVGPESERSGLGCQPVVDEGLIFFNSFDFDGWNGGRIESVGLDGSPVAAVDTEGAHHFFERLPDGSLVWMAIEPREVSGMGDVVGDKIMRQAPDGTLTTLFSAWDHLTVYKTDTWDRPLYAEGADWTHGNGLTHDAARDTLLVSMGGTDVVVELSTEGEVLRLFGGQSAVDGDYQFNPPSSAFSYPHGPHFSADGELMMMSTVNDQSQLVGYEIDDEQQSLRATWSYGAGMGKVVQVLGEVEALPDGNRLVSWGSLGTLQVITPAGEVLWEAQTEFGSLIGQAHLLESPYRSWSP